MKLKYGAIGLLCLCCLVGCANKEKEIKVEVTQSFERDSEGNVNTLKENNLDVSENLRTNSNEFSFNNFNIPCDIYKTNWVDTLRDEKLTSGIKTVELDKKSGTSVQLLEHNYNTYVIKLTIKDLTKFKDKSDLSIADIFTIKTTKQDVLDSLGKPYKEVNAEDVDEFYYYYDTGMGEINYAVAIYTFDKKENLKGIIFDASLYAQAKSKEDATYEFKGLPLESSIFKKGQAKELAKDIMVMNIADIDITFPATLDDFSDICEFRPDEYKDSGNLIFNDGSALSVSFDSERNNIIKNLGEPEDEYKELEVTDFSINGIKINDSLSLEDAKSKFLSEYEYEEDKNFIKYRFSYNSDCDLNLTFSKRRDGKFSFFNIFCK